MFNKAYHYPFEKKNQFKLIHNMSSNPAKRQTAAISFLAAKVTMHKDQIKSSTWC